MVLLSQSETDRTVQEARHPDKHESDKQKPDTGGRNVEAGEDTLETVIKGVHRIARRINA